MEIDTQVNFPKLFPRHVRTALLWIALAAQLASTSCGLTDRLAAAIEDSPGVESPTSDAPRVTVYFTDPGAPGAASWSGGPDEALEAAINTAQESVDIAVYSFSLEGIGEALQRADRRGVAVRLVMERDNLERSLPAQLARNGLPVVGDEGEGRMHNKFVVIDRQEVWTGSMNFTGSGTYQDHNNLVQIRSEHIAENYTTEFEEMYLKRQFGAGSPANTPHPTVERLEVYFSPDDGVEKRLVELVRSAKSSVTVMAFSLTSDALTEALLERASKGARVRVVLDEEQAYSNTGGDYQTLKKAGIDVRLDGIPGQMHHKVLVVDGEWVAFGSYNFTRSAEVRNDENLILARDAELAGLFLEEFENIYRQAKAD